MRSIIFSKDAKNLNSFGVNEIIINLKNNINRISKDKVEIINSKNNLEIFKKIKKSKVVHIHGCWTLSHLKIFIFSVLNNKKIFFSPHGMLMPKALQIKKIRKILALLLYQKIIISKSHKIIVNSETEKRELKKIYDHKYIHVIPHGIKLNRKNFFTRKSKKSLKFVFYSRIHPIKGLLKLLKIWKSSNKLINFNLDIYGKVEDNFYFSKVKNLFTKKIRYLGPLNQNNKYKILKKYDVLLYPSLSENFGLIILEALNSGLYVIMSKKLPWKFLPIEFGKLIPFNKKILEKNIFLLKKNIRKFDNKKKTNLRNYLFNNFSWDRISKKYIDLYQV